MVDCLATYYMDHSPLLFSTPIGPMGYLGYFCLSLATSLDDNRIAASLEVPACVYEKYEYNFQIGCAPSEIAWRLDERPLDLNVSVRPEPLLTLQYNIQTLSYPDKRKL